MRGMMSLCWLDSRHLLEAREPLEAGLRLVHRRYYQDWGGADVRTKPACLLA